MQGDSPGNLPNSDNLHIMAAKVDQQEISWEVSYQGKTHYTAFCEWEVLIVSQDENLQRPDVVPRQKCELTEDDKTKLERLDLPPRSWDDDASILAARAALDKRFTSVRIERSNQQARLNKNRVLQIIQDTMKSSTKPAISIRYFGPGKKNTGDWCFEDGYITFREITGLYMKHFRGKILGIGCDCSYAGSWVKDCMEFLDEQGVQPCAHSAREKMVLVSVTSACKHTEIPYRLLHSIRGVTNDKNTGVLGGWGDGWEVAKDQHIKRATILPVKCENKSIDEPCTLGPADTWRKVLNRDRIFIVRGMDKGRPAWHYVLLVDDEEMISKFKELTQGSSAGKNTLDVSNYGQVLKSGWGHEPPNDVKEWMEVNHGAS